MRKPRPVRQAPGSDYPSLREFQENRRDFLRRMLVGTLAVSVAGPLACIDHHNDQGAPDTASPDARSADTGGPNVQNSPPHDDAVEADAVDGWEPETYENEPWAGGMAEPDFYEVRLPSAGFAQAYMQMGGYVSFAVRFSTWDPAVYQQHLADPEAGLAVAVEVMATRTCEDLGTAAGVDAATMDLRAALEAHAQATIGYGNIEAVELTVEYCDALGPIDGDMAEPQYP